MDCVGNFECDLLPELAIGVEVTAAGNQRIAQVGLHRSISDGDVQVEGKTVGRVAEAKSLVQRVAQTSAWTARDSIAGIVRAQAQIGQQVIVGEANAGVIVCKCLPLGFEFGSRVESLLQSRCRIDIEERFIPCGQLSELQIESAEKRIGFSAECEVFRAYARDSVAWVSGRNLPVSVYRG